MQDDCSHPDHTTVSRDPSIVAILDAQTRTDIGNANRFVNKFRENVRYCHAWKRWLIWDGKRWLIDESGKILKSAMEIPQDLWSEALQADSTAARQFAAKSASKRAMDAMLSIAASDLAILPEELDRFPNQLNCQNTTIHLPTAKTNPHESSEYHSKITPHNYDVQQKPKVWTKFLESTFVDPELIAFIQRLVGYAVYGTVTEHILVILWGSGSNGKTTFIDAILHALGNDYAMTASKELLIVQRHNSHPTSLADLHGKRLVVCSETQDTDKLNEALVKSLTGGDRIKARRMREDFWEFEPSHTLFLATNHKPEVRGRDYAIWRRLRLVPFTQKFTPEKRDNKLREKLRDEAPAILNWIIEGAKLYHEQGLNEPECVRAATDEYRSESDAVGKFVDECCIVGSQYKVKFTDLFSAFESWCDETGEQCLSKTLVGKWFKEHFQANRSNGMWYLGVALKPDFNTDCDN